MTRMGVTSNQGKAPNQLAIRFGLPQMEQTMRSAQVCCTKLLVE